MEDKEHPFELHREQPQQSDETLSKLQRYGLRTYRCDWLKQLKKMPPRQQRLSPTGDDGDDVLISVSFEYDGSSADDR